MKSDDTDGQPHEDAAEKSSDASITTAADADTLLADLSRARGEPRADLLATATLETTALDELIRIKDLGKLFMTDAADSEHREAARLLYHAAVAAAFVHHAATISVRPMHKQQKLYERFAAAWTGHTIGEVFQKALARIAATPRARRPHTS